MKKIVSVFVLLFSFTGFLLANDPDNDIIIKQPIPIEILYAVSAANPNGPHLEIATIFEASSKTMVEDGVVLEPGLFIQDGELIHDGMLAYTGKEPVLLFVQSENGIEAMTVFPGEKLAIGATAIIATTLYCDYCRCTCTANEGDTGNQKNTNIGVGQTAANSNTAYFTWNGILDCHARNGAACETDPGGQDGTLSGCKKVSRKCL